MMSESFIKHLAKTRAEELFTKEYFLKVTDSWFLDELFRFEGCQIGVEAREPNEDEKDIYMKYMSQFFDEYKDKWYSGPLAQDCYSQCIDCFDKLLKLIDYGNKKFQEFNIDDDTIKKIKDLGNVFVNKHNEFCPKNK